MAGISFSGLASGLNTTEIISAMMGVERIPLLRLQEDNQNLRSQLSIINDLSSSLSDLKSKAASLGTMGDFLSYSGSVSDSSVAKVTASGDAVPGTYDLSVTSLAKAQRSYSNTYAEKSDSVTGTEETLTISVNGTDTDITVAAGSSLESVVGLINGSGADVTAGIMFDGSSYRLQVAGNSTGAANAVTFNDNGMNLGLDDPGNTTQIAADAAFTLDGFDITNSTNTITDALPGVTLELESTTTAPVTVTIEPDSGAVKEKVNEFVDAYNEVFSIINAQYGQGKGNDTLNGDSSIRMIEQQLQSMVTGEVPGLADPNGYGLALGRLGIETQKDGSLAVDEDDIDSFLASDFRLAAKIFAGDIDSGVDGMSGLLGDLIDGFTDSTTGLLEARKDGIDGRISSNDDRIESTQTYLEKYEQNLRDQYTRLEETMSSLQSQQSYLAQFLNQ